MIMIFGIYTVYYPFKRRYYGSFESSKDGDASPKDSSVAPTTVISLLKDSKIGWDEGNNNEANPPQSVLPQPVLIAYNSTLLKSLKDVGNPKLSKASSADYETLLGESETPFDLFLYNFVSGGFKLKNFNSKYALETLNHFNTVLKYSQEDNVTSTFLQLNQNATYNLLAFESCLKYIDIVIICLNKGCKGEKWKVATTFFRYESE